MVVILITYCNHCDHLILKCLWSRWHRSYTSCHKSFLVTLDVNDVNLFNYDLIIPQVWATLVASVMILTMRTFPNISRSHTRDFMWNSKFYFFPQTTGDFIESALAAGGKVVVNCWGGHWDIMTIAIIMTMMIMMLTRLNNLMVLTTLILLMTMMLFQANLAHPRSHWPSSYRRPTWPLKMPLFRSSTSPLSKL